MNQARHMRSLPMLDLFKLNLGNDFIDLEPLLNSYWRVKGLTNRGDIVQAGNYDQVMLGELMRRKNRVFEIHQPLFTTLLERTLVATYLLNNKNIIIDDDIKYDILNTFNDIHIDGKLLIPYSVIEAIPYWGNKVTIDMHIDDIYYDFCLFGLRRVKGVLYLVIYLNKEYLDKDQDIDNYTERLKYAQIEHDTILLKLTPSKDHTNFYEPEVSMTCVGLDSSIEDIKNEARRKLDAELELSNRTISRVLPFICYISTLNSHDTSDKNNSLPIATNGIFSFTVPTPKEVNVKATDLFKSTLPNKPSKSSKSEIKANTKSSSTRESHIRRGHWRMQWYGPKNNIALRHCKLKFIPQTLVRGTK